MTHNIQSGLYEGRASKGYKRSNLAQCLIVAQMFNKSLMFCFCKSPCYGQLKLVLKFSQMILRRLGK